MENRNVTMLVFVVVVAVFKEKRYYVLEVSF